MYFYPQRGRLLKSALVCVIRTRSLGTLAVCLWRRFNYKAIYSWMSLYGFLALYSVLQRDQSHLPPVLFKSNLQMETQSLAHSGIWKHIWLLFLLGPLSAVIKQLSHSWRGRCLSRCHSECCLPCRQLLNFLLPLCSCQQPHSYSLIFNLMNTGFLSKPWELSEAIRMRNGHSLAWDYLKKYLEYLKTNHEIVGTRWRLLMYLDSPEPLSSPKRRTCLILKWLVLQCLEH